MANNNKHRRALLALVHIAKKELRLDDVDYQSIVCSHSKINATSAADCSDQELKNIIKYFERIGWKNKKSKPRKKARNTSNSTHHQILFARQLWILLYENGVVRDSSDAAFRRFIKSQTRKLHPSGAGYSALQFAPTGVAQRVIEQLKQWAARNGINTDGVKI